MFSKEQRFWILTHVLRGIRIFWVLDHVFRGPKVQDLAIWLISNQRNQVVFKGKGANPYLAKGIIMQATKFALCINRPKGNQLRMIKQIKWEKPDTGWVKLNTDELSSDPMNTARGEGLIRDDQRNWIAGFSRNIGKANSFTIEIWAIWDGLLSCHQMNLPAVIVELDAKALVDGLSNPAYANSIIFPLFDDCR